MPDPHEMTAPLSTSKAKPKAMMELTLSRRGPTRSHAVLQRNRLDRRSCCDVIIAVHNAEKRKMSTTSAVCHFRT
jgi:hypothetical protein